MNPQSHKNSEFWAEQVSFLGEQDGAPEAELKALLSEFFKANGQIELAYLARVSYSKLEEGIALCLMTKQKNQEQQLMHQIAEIFSSMFSQDEQLDIIFLSDANAVQIARVCQPFFRAVST